MSTYLDELYDNLWIKDIIDDLKVFIEFEEFDSESLTSDITENIGNIRKYIKDTYFRLYSSSLTADNLSAKCTQAIKNIIAKSLSLVYFIDNMYV